MENYEDQHWWSGLWIIVLIFCHTKTYLIHNQGYCWLIWWQSAQRWISNMQIPNPDGSAKGKVMGSQHLNRFPPDGSVDVHDRFTLWKYGRRWHTDGGCSSASLAEVYVLLTVLQAGWRQKGRGRKGREEREEGTEEREKGERAERER